MKRGLDVVDKEDIKKQCTEDKKLIASDPVTYNPSPVYKENLDSFLKNSDGFSKKDFLSYIIPCFTYFPHRKEEMFPLIMKNKNLVGSIKELIILAKHFPTHKMDLLGLFMDKEYKLIADSKIEKPRVNELLLLMCHCPDYEEELKLFLANPSNFQMLVKLKEDIAIKDIISLAVHLPENKKTWFELFSKIMIDTEFFSTIYFAPLATEAKRLPNFESNLKMLAYHFAEYIDSSFVTRLKQCFILNAKLKTALERVTKIDEIGKMIENTASVAKKITKATDQSSLVSLNFLGKQKDTPSAKELLDESSTLAKK